MKLILISISRFYLIPYLFLLSKICYYFTPRRHLIASHTHAHTDIDRSDKKHTRAYSNHYVLGMNRSK